MKRSASLMRTCLAFLLVLQCCLVVVVIVVVAEPPLRLAHETIGGPSIPNNQTSYQEWRQLLDEYRTATLSALNYNDTYYTLPQSQYIRHNFMQPQQMIHDITLYSRESGYTVHKYMSDIIQRYGGINSILLWHSYPNIGIDNRNQFDMFRSLPGFPDKIIEMINIFHNIYNVTVLIPYNPWDTNTRPDDSDDIHALLDIIQKVDADGFNGDTMSGVPAIFLQTAITQYHHLIQIQPEVGLDGDVTGLPTMLATDLSSWGYWDNDPTLVSKYKLLEHRHITNICNRWQRYHINDLQQTWFNGVGFESWENVWGIYNQLSQRDAEITKRIGFMSQFFWEILMESDIYEPHIVTIQSGIYTTRFDKEFSTSLQVKNITVFTVINISNQNKTGEQIIIDYNTYDYYFFDCYHGEKLHVSSNNNNNNNNNNNGNQTIVSFDIEANGFGCIYIQPISEKLPLDFQSFLHTIHNMTLLSLSSYDPTPIILTQQHIPIPLTPVVSTTPVNMTYIPGHSSYQFIVNGIEIEGGNNYVDIQYNIFNETSPHRYHNLTIEIKSFYMDIYPITRLNYFNYLNESHYIPDLDKRVNFLTDWIIINNTNNNTTNNNNSDNNNNIQWIYPKNTDLVPVTSISLEEARSYCAYYNKRLPTEWEWQYAAQGGDSQRVYPWGNVWNASLVPVTDTSRSPRAPDEVTAHPSGQSPFGIMDLVGNIWQWTSEFTDTHTRRAIIRGGSLYVPQTSHWYFPQAHALNTHGHYLLMDETMDRAKYIGFRCVVDAKQHDDVTYDHTVHNTFRQTADA